MPAAINITGFKHELPSTKSENGKKLPTIKLHIVIHLYQVEQMCLQFSLIQDSTSNTTFSSC